MLFIWIQKYMFNFPFLTFFNIKLMLLCPRHYILPLRCITAEFALSLQKAISHTLAIHTHSLHRTSCYLNSAWINYVDPSDTSLLLILHGTSHKSSEVEQWAIKICKRTQGLLLHIIILIVAPKAFSIMLLQKRTSNFN